MKIPAWKSVVLSAALCLASWCLSAQQKFTHTGYVKDLISAIHVRDFGTSWDNLVHHRGMFQWQIDTVWSVRADLRTRLFYGDQVRNPFFADAIDAGANDILDLSLGAELGSNAYLHSYLDRAYVEMIKGKLEVRAGRQRINWGINTLWNPNDIFNAYAFTDFDYEERPGSDALSVRYFTSDLSSIEFVGKLGDRDRDGALAALWRTHVGTYDLQFLSGYLTSSEYAVFGGGWAGNLKNWGFKGEGSAFAPLNSEDQFAGAFSTSVDYIFPGGLLIGFGGLYNALGKMEGGLEELFNFELSARDLYPFRWTLEANAGFSVHPLVNVSVTGVYSIAESHPVFLSPAVTWSAARNLDIDLVSQIVFQKTGERYGSPVQGLFLRAKWNY